MTDDVVHMMKNTGIFVIIFTYLYNPEAQDSSENESRLYQRVVFKE